MALAFLDLDNFKLINDTLGHHAGDELLRSSPAAWLACVRKSDMIVRVGGDEFIILLTGLPPDSSIVTSRFEDIRTAIGAPLVSFGAQPAGQLQHGRGLLIPITAQTATELLANADAAMYRAKEVGRNNLQLFDAEMASKAREKLLRHEELRDAVARGEFAPALSAADGPADRPHLRRRGAGALAASGSAACLAGRNSSRLPRKPA